GVDAAREQRIGLRAAAGKVHPLHLQVRHAAPGGFLLDQALLLHHVRGQVKDAGLSRDGDLALLLSDGGQWCDEERRARRDRSERSQGTHRESLLRDRAREDSRAMGSDAKATAPIGIASPRILTRNSKALKY